jgi:hypothetical protein
MVKTRITNCRFKIYQPTYCKAYRKIQEKAEKISCWIFFEEAEKTQMYQFWRHDNKPIELWSNKVIQQRQIMYTIILSKKG